MRYQRRASTEPEPTSADLGIAAMLTITAIGCLGFIFIALFPQLVRCLPCA